MLHGFYDVPIKAGQDEEDVDLSWHLVAAAVLTEVLQSFGPTNLTNWN